MHNNKNKQTILITGGAGFIGSHLVDRLIKNNRVIVFDRFGTNKEKNISQHFGNRDFCLIKGDLLNPRQIKSALKGVEIVYHLAANPDVRLGASDSKVHFEQNIVTTYNLLEAMRQMQVKEIVFTSSSVVYGKATKIPTPEDYGPLIPISLYGASKLACEGLISAYCHTFDFRTWILRLANIIGPRSTHGIIFDFINKLKKNPKKLEILGNGKQVKSYLYIDDCIEAILCAVNKSYDKVNIFNIGSQDQITTNEIAKIVVRKMGLKNVKFEYTGGEGGWKGDVPQMLLDVAKIKKLGWKPNYNSRQSVEKTVENLLR